MQNISIFKREKQSQEIRCIHMQNMELLLRFRKKQYDGDQNLPSQYVTVDANNRIETLAACWALLYR